jgi:hypothetical protein
VRSRRSNVEMPQSSTSALGSSARMTHSLTINFQDWIRNRRYRSKSSNSSTAAGLQ